MVYAHSIHNPDGVRFVGPLAPLAAELKGEFARLGYATSSATAQLQLAAHCRDGCWPKVLGPMR